MGYTDLFRGLPTLLVVFLVCFGVPALRLQGVTTSLFWLALVALVLSYGAYVAEVFRAGIESVHPSQVASATPWASATGSPCATSWSRRRCAGSTPAAQRLRLAAEGHRAGGLRRPPRRARHGVGRGNYNFNFTPYLVAGALFVALTVPLARFTDWLGRRVMERERAGAR